MTVSLAVRRHSIARSAIHLVPVGGTRRFPQPAAGNRLCQPQITEPSRTRFATSPSRKTQQDGAGQTVRLSRRSTWRASVRRDTTAIAARIGEPGYLEEGGSSAARR